jgi:plasmid stabilization system protein ParE
VGALDLTARAKKDMFAIHRRIAEDRTLVADDYIDRMLTTLATLTTQPHAGQRRDDLRKRLRIFSFEEDYVIAYFPKRDGIRVLRILRGARNWEAILRGK